MDKKQRDKLFEMARKNTKYNADGHAVISRNDEWVEETEWEEMFNRSEEVVTNEKYTPKRNMVCAVPT